MSARERKQNSASLPRPLKVVVGVGAVALLALLALFVLSFTPAFSVTSIEADATEHLTSDTIGKLANVSEGTTLLNVDVDAIEANLKKNPWVGDVSVTREFPDRVRVVVTERKVGAVVLMSSGNIAWYLGDDGAWIEPFNIGSSTSASGSDAALARATELGCLLITNVPSTVSPVAGSASSDACILAVLQYQSEFSSDLSSQVVSYSAASAESVACSLSSGVQISLGSPSSISSKEAVIDQILATYPGQITYINVRVPSKPTYRKVGTDQVASGAAAGSDTTAATETASE